MYLFNLLFNIFILLKYYFSKKYDSSVMKCLLSLLKFDVKIEHINKNICINSFKCEIDIIITKNNIPIYIEVKGISNNTNSNNHLDILEQFKKHKKHIGFIKYYILFINGKNNVRLQKNTEDKIKELIGDNIKYNYIDKLPEIKYNNDIVITQEFLGFIVSDIIPDFIHKYIYKFFHNKISYIDKNTFDKFDKRMTDSKSIIERNRWDIIKNKLTIFDIRENDRLNFIDYNKPITTKHKKALNYAYRNNHSIVILNNSINFKGYYIYMNYINFYPIPIFGSHQYNSIRTSKLKILLYFKYIMCFIFFLCKI